MKSFWNKFIQVTASVGQVANFMSAMVPMEAKPYVAGSLAIAQAVAAMAAHKYNPDGTKAEVAYVKEIK